MFRLIFLAFIIQTLSSCSTSVKSEQLAAPERVKSGPKTGEWISRRPDGTIKTRVSYANGLKDGVSYLYYDDGKTIQLQMPYAAGQRQGTSIKYFENGSLYAETSYDRDILHGPRITYYRNGEVKSRISYQYGLTGSDLVEYYQSGKQKELPEIIFARNGNKVNVSVAPSCSEVEFFFGGLSEDGFFDEESVDTRLSSEDGQFTIELNQYTPSYLKYQDLVCRCKSSQGNPIILSKRIVL